MIILLVGYIIFVVDYIGDDYILVVVVVDDDDMVVDNIIVVDDGGGQNISLKWMVIH